MPTAILVRLALLEARRGGLAWLALAAVAVSIGVAGFLGQVAITESRMLQAAVVAALLRVGAVFVITAQVVVAVRREIDDRRLEASLALPLSRTTQYLGRLGGFALCGALLAAACSLPLLFLSPAASVAAWALSLALELVVVAAAALFFAMSLSSAVPALAATAGFYLLGRSISAVQAIAGGPLAENSTVHQIARHVVDAVALVLPALDRVTRTEWLLYGLDGKAYASALGSLVLYAALLAAAGLVDFQRRVA